MQCARSGAASRLGPSEQQLARRTMATIVLTGCRSGFGFHAALKFAQNGDQVFATMRDVSESGPLEGAAQAEGLEIQVLELDVTAPESFAPVIDRVLEKAGAIDVLVNNAGLLRPGALEDVPEAVLRDVMETNFFGPVLLMKAVLPQMRAQGSGCIINVSSLSGLAGLPGDTVYAASKFALEGATEALRHEIDRWGIRVALVEPGLYATDLFASAPEDLGLPDYIAPDSPYRALTQEQLAGIRERIPNAPHPALVAELLVEIAHSKRPQLRWPSDARAGEIAAQLRTLGDQERDAFLRQASGTSWWSDGRAGPP